MCPFWRQAGCCRGLCLSRTDTPTTEGAFLPRAPPLAKAGTGGALKPAPEPRPLQLPAAFCRLAHGPCRSVPGRAFEADVFADFAQIRTIAFIVRLRLQQMMPRSGTGSSRNDAEVCLARVSLLARAVCLCSCRSNSASNRLPGTRMVRGRRKSRRPHVARLGGARDGRHNRNCRFRHPRRPQGIHRRPCGGL